MARPPLAPRSSIVTVKLLAYSTLQIGVIQCLAAYCAFFVVLVEAGFPLSTLGTAAATWDDPSVIINAKVCGRATGFSAPRRTLTWPGAQGAATLPRARRAPSTAARRWHTRRPRTLSPWCGCSGPTYSYASRGWTACLCTVSSTSPCSTEVAPPLSPAVDGIARWLTRWAFFPRGPVQVASSSSNWRLGVSVLACSAVMAAIVYVPYMNDLFGTRMLTFPQLLPALPFAAFIIAYDELRKACIRRWPHGWVARATAW